MTELPPFNNPPPRPTMRSLENPLPGPTTSPAATAPPQETGDRWEGMRSLLAWILRWALLGAGVGGAWLFGILVAQFFPDPTPAAPTQEIVSRKASRFVQKVRRLPDWWAGDTLTPQTPSRLPAPSSEPAPTIAPARPIALSDAEREQVSVELEAIAQEIQQLRDRTSAVERQLGLSEAEISLEDRIENATNRLFPPTEAPPPDSETASTSGLRASDQVPDPLFQVNAYRVTLPSDVLFDPNQAILQTDAQPLLDSILQELARYSDAKILVGSYTDFEPEGSTSTELSYQQAMAVQRYLSQRLGDETIHWVTVGYGNSDIGSTGGVQLSRRITLAIVP